MTYILSILGRDLQRNRINEKCIYRQIYFKDLAHGHAEVQVQNP
jgi:hypothetical protein